MQLAFLGTGAAFSTERYNGAIVVDGRVLLDAGAPLLPHMHRLGIDPGAIEAVFITHFHGDHVLGLPPFVLHRGFFGDRPFTVVGPPGVARRMEQLFELAWGADWPALRARIPMTYMEADGPGDVAGVEFSPVRLDHGSSGCTGYRLAIDNRVLAYAGDTEPTPPLEELVRGADIAIVEATAPIPQPSHSTWEDARALRDRHPNTRFFFNHVFAGELEGGATDLLVVDV